MSVETVVITALDCTCENCSHRWRAAGTKPPSRCPACHARTWNKSAVRTGPFGSRLRTREQVDAMLERRAAAEEERHALLRR
jgi:hypothetical protein